MSPFLVLVLLSIAGIVRIALIFEPAQAISLLILLYWIIRNLYFLVMALFLVDGRDSDGEPVRVTEAEPVLLECNGTSYEGITTLLTEHNLTVFLDDGGKLPLGATVQVTAGDGENRPRFRGVVTSVNESRRRSARTHTIEILEHDAGDLEYLQFLYDRIPTLPQSLHRDFGLLPHLWQNIAHRVARSAK